MTSYDEHTAESGREQRLSFLTYFLAASGILVAVMFLSTAYYLTTLN